MKPKSANHSSARVVNRNEIHLLSGLMLFVLLNFSCTKNSDKEQNDSAFAITNCGTVQFTGGCGEGTDTLIAYGLALVHHMTYEDAEMVFDKVIETTPDCFWGYWGKAMSYIHPLWPGEPTEDQMNNGWELAQKALEKASSPKEKIYGEALAAYYQNGLERPHKERLKSMQEKWQSGFDANPQDLEAKSFYALSLISVSDPTDKSYQNQLKAGKMAEEVLKAIPNHPGGFHYTIHAYDYPELADKAIAAAEKYSSIAPDVPHALHMPSHIFTRMGLWEESIDWNTRSAIAALEQPVNNTVSGHYFHAADYLVYAYLQRLEDEMALETIEQVRNMEGPYQDVGATAYALAATEGRYALERQDWKRAALLENTTDVSINWEKFPEYEAIKYFAIGVGGARGGLLDKAEGAVSKLNELKQKTGNPYWAQQIDVQINTVNAWLAYAHGNKDQALELMTLAANQENATNKHPITPGELLPASELLGDMLLELNQPEEALAQYEIALQRSQRRFNSLYGAGYAAELSGNQDKAKMYYETLVEMTKDGDLNSPRRKKASAYLNKGVEI